MTATILDGRPPAASIREEIKSRVEKRVRQGAAAPALQIVRVGTDEAGRLYAERLSKAGAGVGIAVQIDHHDDELNRARLISLIDALNENRSIHGVVVVMPLPKHLKGEIVSERLDPAKDVDGITNTNAAGIYLGRPAHVPSTAAAIMEILDRYEIELTGRDAVVVGRSPVVGKPAAMLLLARHATVTMCHTRTVDLASHTVRADILIAGAGSPGCIRGSMIKPGGVVVDAGINFVGGTVVGDVVFAEAVEMAGAITPVPGGVGPLTNAILLRSVLENAERIEINLT